MSTPDTSNAAAVPLPEHLQEERADDGGKSQAWMFTAALIIGLLSGVAAYLFRLLIGSIHNFAFLGQLSPWYEANQHTAASPWGWGVILVPVAGSFVVIWLVRNFAPEAKGHGVPEVIDAIHYKQGAIQGKVSLVKALASATTIGTGGSLGREGPIVQIGAALSSGLAGLFNVPPRQRIVLLACGASAGIAATFNAPLAGVLFSIELLLITVNSRSLMLVAVSTVLSAQIGRLLIGPEPAFVIPPTAVNPMGDLEHPFVLLWFFPFGALVGVVAYGIIRVLYGSIDLFERLIGNDYLRHAVGTLLLGIVFYSFQQTTGHYYVQGVGYATIADILTQTLANPWFILLLMAAKLLAVSLTLGSGGSGGVFSPFLFFGVTLGAVFGGLLALIFPDSGINTVTFALAGMASIVAAATSAPLTAAVITYEMTLDYAVILPVMISVGIAYAVRYSISRADVYTIKLMRRGRVIPGGLSTDLQGGIPVEHIMSRAFRVLERGTSFSPSEDITVVTEQGRVVGLARPFPHTIDFDVPVEEMMCPDFVVLPPEISLAKALRRMHKGRCEVALVCAKGRCQGAEGIVGVLRHGDIVALLGRTAELHHD